MTSWKPLGLIAAGRMSNSLLLRRPALSRHIGPVVAQDRRLATRYANSLRAGSAARVEDLRACGLVLIHAAGGSLDRVLPLLRAQETWKGSHFALLSPDLGSAALSELRQAGARVCAAAQAPARSRDLVVVEGDARAVKLTRQWLAEGRMRCLELAPGRMTLFHLGLLASRGLLAPLLDAALMSLRASGLSAAESRRLLFEAADFSLRAFAARGRKALEDPAAPGRALLLELALEQAGRSNPRLARFFTDLLEAVDALYAPPPEPESPQDSRFPTRAAGIH